MAPAPTMHAVRMAAYGDPSVLDYQEVPRPVPGAGEVLVASRATSVSRWDVIYRRGEVGPPPGRAPFPLPQQLGREAAGVVVGLGPGVTRFAEGDRVVAMTCPACGRCAMCLRGRDNLCVDTALPGHQRFGGYADYLAIPESALLPAPDGVDFEELACCLWSYGTVWHMIFTRGRFSAGEDVLVTAASSGMGTACLQLLRHAGAGTVVALTGSPGKAERLRELGADLVVDYHDDDAADQVREATNSGIGPDLVLDNVGGPMLPFAVDAVRLGGTVVNAAVHGGRVVELNLRTLFAKEVDLLGARAATRREQEQVLALAGRGAIRPEISRVFPLSEAAEAHRELESGAHVGKLVLIPEGAR